MPQKHRSSHRPLRLDPSPRQVRRRLVYQARLNHWLLLLPAVRQAFRDLFR